jgi:hypothetical protein
MRIHAKWIDQTVQLIGCLRHFGGRQWYFVCPAQNRCVSVMWSLPGRRFFAGRKSLGKRSRICPGTIRQELARIIRLISFTTASGSKMRWRSWMCYQSRSGCDGGPTADCKKGLNYIVARPVCYYRDRSSSTATWFRPRAPRKNRLMNRNMLANHKF